MTEPIADAARKQVQAADDADRRLFESVLTELYTPVVGDILDQFGHYHRFLPQPIQPLTTPMKLVGRAMPVLQTQVFGKQDAPFGLMTQALDALGPGDIYICTGGGQNSANWGEIMTAAARTGGAAGAVIDGFHRDTPRVLEQNWPVFTRGRFAQDSGPRMKVTGFGEPIEVGDVWVRPGDLVFGDLDGVLVIPRELESRVIEAALEKARAEKTVRHAIEQGMSTTEAYRTYGVL